MAADRAGIEIVSMPAELDLTTSEGVVEQGCAAIARPVRLLLLDLTGLSFCDARGLGAFVRIANQADAAGCRFRPHRAAAAGGEDPADQRPGQPAAGIRRHRRRTGAADGYSRGLGAGCSDRLGRRSAGASGTRTCARSVSPVDLPEVAPTPADPGDVCLASGIAQFHAGTSWTSARDEDLIRRIGDRGGVLGCCHCGSGVSCPAATGRLPGGRAARSGPELSAIKRACPVDEVPASSSGPSRVRPRNRRQRRTGCGRRRGRAAQCLAPHWTHPPARARRLPTAGFPTATVTPTWPGWGGGVAAPGIAPGRRKGRSALLKSLPGCLQPQPVIQRRAAPAGWSKGAD